MRHFQQLFDVPHLDGVYAAMSSLYQQTEHAKNIFKQLKTSLQLGRYTVKVYVASFTFSLKSSKWLVKVYVP